MRSPSYDPLQLSLFLLLLILRPMQKQNKLQRWHSFFATMLLLSVALLILYFSDLESFHNLSLAIGGDTGAEASVNSQGMQTLLTTLEPISSLFSLVAFLTFSLLVGLFGTITTSVLVWRKNKREAQT